MLEVGTKTRFDRKTVWEKAGHASGRWNPLLPAAHFPLARAGGSSERGGLYPLASIVSGKT